MGKTQVRFLFFTAIAAIVVVVAANPFSGGDGEPPSAALAAPGPGSTVGECSQRPSELDTGTDVFDSTAELIIDLGGGAFPVSLEGDTTVERSPDPDPHQEGVIDIEIMEMSLVSTAPIGITLTAGRYTPWVPSFGELASSSGYDDFPAESFFDVYMKVDDGAGGVYYNQQPVRMEATLNPDPKGVVCLPPYDHVYAASNLPVDLYDLGSGEPVGTLDYAVHIPEPPRSITVIKLDGETEEPLPGAVFTLHDGTGCVDPAVGATTTDATGVGDLGPMGGGIYSVQEVIPPEGSELPSNTCTDVDHTVPYDVLEVIDGGSVFVGGLDYFPSNAKFIFDIPTVPELDYVVLNGQTRVDRGPLITGPPDYISTQIVSMELTGIHPILGPITVTAGAGLGTTGLPPSPGVIQNVVNDGVNLTYGDSFFDVYVEIDVAGLPGVLLYNTMTIPIPLYSPIYQLPPELDFFDNGFVPVPLVDYNSGTPMGSLTYSLYVPLPRGELDVIIQDPPGPPEDISFSIETGGPTNATYHAADILAPGPVLVRPCISLGLTGPGCAMTTPQDDLNSLSYGYDFSSADPAEPLKVFSVDPASLGLPPTEVRTEATCPGGTDAPADLFRTQLLGSNQQEFDGDGLYGCLVSYPLGLVEPGGPPSGDNLNALGELPDGDPVYFTLAPASPSLTLLPGGPYTEAHIFKSTSGVVTVYATPGDLGLTAGADVVDALALRESDGIFDSDFDSVFDGPPDYLQFSLAPGSPTLNTLGASAGDQFIPPPTAGGLPAPVIPANAHGLQDRFQKPPDGDNLDAMKAPRLDSDGDGVPDPIDVGVAAFDDGTISGSLAGAITVTAVLPNSVQVETPMGGGGGVFATCPPTVDSDVTLITLSLADGEIAVLGCEASAGVTIVNGPAFVAFGPFTATVQTGSKVIIRQLPSPAAGPCPGTVPAGAYQIVHSVGTLDVTIFSGSMSPVALPPGGVYRDCDGDAVFGAVDNCSDDANPLQTNTDVALAVAGATRGLGIPLLGDSLGDVCDDEDDNESASQTQDPGTAAGTCPPGTLPVWADCVETYLGTVLGDNCKGAPGPGGDAYPPDINVDGSVNMLDVFPMFPFWLGSSPTGREDLNADGSVNMLDVFLMFPSWLQTCS